jgi:uncharacterized alpha-E superfamily protein
LISRVADHCFWLGRYLERAESTARVLSVTSNVSLDAELTPEECWRPVIIVSGEREHFFGKHGDGADRDGETVQRFMTWDEDNLTCIERSIASARENARSIREVVSLEGWESTNELYLWMQSPEARASFEKDRFGFYRHIRRGVQLVLGLLRSTMLHDAPLDFIWLGVMLERIGQTARVLDVHHHFFRNLAGLEEVVETALWLSLLRSCSGFEPFMKRNQGAVTAESVARFLIFEPAFPRSLRFCLDAAAGRFLREIRPETAEASPPPGAQTAARLGALTAWLHARSQEPLPADVHDLLTHVVDETAAVCNLLSAELFYAKSGPARAEPEAPAVAAVGAAGELGYGGTQTQSQSQNA